LQKSRWAIAEQALLYIFSEKWLRQLLGSHSCLALDVRIGLFFPGDFRFQKVGCSRLRILMKSSKVSADLKKNRLSIILIGVLSTKGMEGIYTEIRFCVADLKPGFEVMTDLTQCKIAHLGGLGTFGKIKEFLSAKEVGPVIRIVKKNQLVFNQISRVADMTSKYRPHYVSTLAEAEKLFAQLKSGEG
jgi:hypothetical protein